MGGWNAISLVTGPVNHVENMSIEHIAARAKNDQKRLTQKHNALTRRRW